MQSLATDVAQLTDGRSMLRGRMADGESVHSDRWCRKIEKARSRGPIHFFLEVDLSVNFSLARVAAVAQIIGNWPIVLSEERRIHGDSPRLKQPFRGVAAVSVGWFFGSECRRSLRSLLNEKWTGAMLFLHLLNRTNSSAKTYELGEFLLDLL